MRSRFVNSLFNKSIYVSLHLFNLKSSKIEFDLLFTFKDELFIKILFVSKFLFFRKKDGEHKISTSFKKLELKI